MSDTRTLDDILSGARTELRAKGIETASLDVRLLAQNYFKLSHEEIILSDSKIIENNNQLESFTAAIKRRVQGEPVSKIIGQKEFYGRMFKTSRDVLDPRPETEILVEQALIKLKEKTSPHILDLGCGSGCIIISLLAECSQATGVAIDISGKALQIARQNAIKHDVINRVSFIQGGWDSANSIAEQNPFDIVVSNPPYIASKVIPDLESEVREFDPILALDGGEDGLEAYKNIFAQLKFLLHPQGCALFEIGYDQADSIKRLAKSTRFEHSDLIMDYSGHPRVFIISTGKT